jgi:hypothetical protein
VGMERSTRREFDPHEIGERQSLFREVNERIGELAEGFDMRDALTILCECGNPDCSEKIELSEAEYERLRLIPTRFAVLPGHDIPAVERVVEENERFAVVEKVGESAVVAVANDPLRSREEA